MITTLTPRQKQILTLLVQDHDRKQIAQMLGIKVWTVSNHIYNARLRFGVHTTECLVVTVNTLLDCNDGHNDLS